MRKALGRHEIANLLRYLADHALQERLTTFAMTAEKADHAGGNDLGNVVALLK
jgi:hypothetical protein